MNASLLDEIRNKKNKKTLKAAITNDKSAPIVTKVVDEASVSRADFKAQLAGMFGGPASSSSSTPSSASASNSTTSSIPTPTPAAPGHPSAAAPPPPPGQDEAEEKRQKKRRKKERKEKKRAKKEAELKEQEVLLQKRKKRERERQRQKLKQKQTELGSMAKPSPSSPSLSAEGFGAQPQSQGDAFQDSARDAPRPLVSYTIALAVLCSFNTTLSWPSLYPLLHKLEWSMPTFSGLMFAIFPLAQCISSLCAASIVPRVSIKILLAVAALLAIAGNVCLVFATTHERVFLLAGSRILGGVAGGMCVAAVPHLARYSRRPLERGWTLARLSFLQETVCIVAPIIGVFLAQWDTLEAVGLSAYTLSSAVMTVCLVLFLLVLALEGAFARARANIVLHRFQRTFEEDDEVDRLLDGRADQVSAEGRVKCAVIIAIYATAVAVYWSFLSCFMVFRSSNLPQWRRINEYIIFPVLTAVACGTYVVIRLLAEREGAKGASAPLLSGLLIMLVGEVVMTGITPFALDSPQTWIGGILLTVGFCVVTMYSADLFGRLWPVKDRAGSRGMCLYFAWLCVGRLVGPLLGFGIVSSGFTVLARCGAGALVIALCAGMCVLPSSSPLLAITGQQAPTASLPAPMDSDVFSPVSR